MMRFGSLGWGIQSFALRLLEREPMAGPVLKRRVEAILGHPLKPSTFTKAMLDLEYDEKRGVVGRYLEIGKPPGPTIVKEYRLRR